MSFFLLCISHFTTHTTTFIFTFLFFIMNSRILGLFSFYTYLIFLIFYSILIGKNRTAIQIAELPTSAFPNKDKETNQNILFVLILQADLLNLQTCFRFCVNLVRGVLNLMSEIILVSLTYFFLIQLTFEGNMSINKQNRHTQIINVHLISYTVLFR